MKLVILTFFVILAADVARSQGVRRERPPDLPKTSTKKGQRPSGRPIRVRNFGPPPPPPRPQGSRDFYDFNFYHRRKDPIIPVELHPPILRRPQTKDSFRERPRSRSAAERSKRRRTTTPEPTPPTTYYDLTTFPTTSTTPQTAPPTTTPVKTTTKIIPASPTTQRVIPKTTTVTLKNSNSGIQSTANKAVLNANNKQTNLGPKQSYGTAGTPSSVKENVNSLQTSDSVSNNRMYAQTFFGSNKIPRPPPLPVQSFEPVVNTKRTLTRKSEMTADQFSKELNKKTTLHQSVSYKFKSVPQSYPIFEMSRSSNLRFRRPSDIPAEQKPNIISSLSTETLTEPPPSNPEKCATRTKTQINSNIEIQKRQNTLSKQKPSIVSNSQNEQNKANYERVSQGSVFDSKRALSEINSGQMQTGKFAESVLTSKYSPQSSYQSKIVNEVSSFTSSTGSKQGSAGVISQPNAQSRDVQPEFASAFIENRMPTQPQVSPSGDRGSKIREWQNQPLPTKPFRNIPIETLQRNIPPVTDGYSVDQSQTRDSKTRSTRPFPKPIKFTERQTNNQIIAPESKSSVSNKPRPFNRNVNVPKSSTQVGEETQFQQREISGPISSESQINEPYRDAIVPYKGIRDTQIGQREISRPLPSASLNTETYRDANVRYKSGRETQFQQRKISGSFSSPSQNNEPYWNANVPNKDGKDTQFKQNEISGSLSSASQSNQPHRDAIVPYKGGRDSQLKQTEISGSSSSASQTNEPYRDAYVPYKDPNAPIASKFNTMDMKSGVISSVRQNFNGNLGTPSLEKRPTEQRNSIQEGLPIKQRIASPMFTSDTQRRDQNEQLKPIYNVGLMGPKLNLDRPGVVKSSPIIEQPRIASNSIGGKQQLQKQRPINARRFKDQSYRTIGSHGQSVDKLFEPSAKSASYSVGSEQISNRDSMTSNTFSRDHLSSNMNHNRPIIGENSPKAFSKAYEETFSPGLNPRNNIISKYSNKHNQLPSLEQQPEWSISRSRETQANLKRESVMAAKDSNLSYKRQSLVMSPALPEKNAHSRSNEQSFADNYFIDKQSGRTIDLADGVVGRTSQQQQSSSTKAHNSGTRASHGLANNQRIEDNVISRSGQSSQVEAERSKTGIESSSFKGKQQESMSISYTPVERRREPGNLKQATRVKASNSATLQSENETKRQSKAGEGQFLHQPSNRNTNIAKTKNTGQNKDSTLNNREVVFGENGHSNDVQNKQQARQSYDRVNPEPKSLTTQTTTKQVNMVKPKPTPKSMTMTKAASERVRKVGSLMLEAFNKFLSKINGGKQLPSSNHHGKLSHKHKQSPSADRTEQSLSVRDLSVNANKSNKSDGNKRTSQDNDKKESTIKSKMSKSKLRKSPDNALDIEIGEVQNAERQLSETSQTTLKQSSNKRNISKSSSTHQSKNTNNKVESKAGSRENIGTTSREYVASNGNPKINDKPASVSHNRKGGKLNKSPSGKNNEPTIISYKPTSNISSSTQQTTKTPTETKMTNKGQRFESKIISGPPPPSFRKNKNKALGPKKQSKRRQRGHNKGARRGGGPKNKDNDPPGYNVPPSAHPPVLMRPVNKGGSQGGNSASKNSAERTSKPSAQKRGGKPGQGPCSLSPVCGSDGFTYMSSCFLWDGLTVACDGYCPCPTGASKPVLKQTSQTGVVREPVPSPMCNCPAKYSPVCSTTGRTFENDCARACNGEKIACNGECPCPTTYPKKRKPCESYCSHTFRPVCSVWGYSYENDCLRHCSGEAKACDGECPCPYNQNVVTGPAGGQYSYDPQNVNNEPSNQPLSTCECRPGDIDPVCTTSGETLWYGCEAICLGYTIACSSECPC